MSGAYWEWWQGALALGGLTVAYRFVTGRPMGVSGVYARLIAFNAERQRDQEAALIAANEAALQELMRKETIAAFGPDAVVDEEPPAKVDRSALAPTPPVTSHLLFFVMIVLGALIARFVHGGGAVALSTTPDETISSFWGSGVWLALGVGGLLVGFGTRMAGGCTSGHGLSGCARLVPASFIATAAFFGTGVVLSLVLSRFGS